MTHEQPDFLNEKPVTPHEQQVVVDDSHVQETKEESKSRPRARAKNVVGRMAAAGKSRARKQTAELEGEVKPKSKPERSKKYFAEQAKQKAEMVEAETKKFGTHFYAGAELKPLETQKPQVEVQHSQEDFKKLSSIYEKKGLGEIAVKLAALPEFQNLPQDQKLLVMQGVSDKLLARVRLEGSKGFREEYTHSSFLKKVWKGMIKNSVQAKHEKEALMSLSGKDAATFVGEVAPGLIKVYAQSGLNTFVRDDGSVIAMYSGLDTKYLVDDTSRFNYAATELSRIPDDWNKPGATWGERREYTKALKKFEEEKKRYLLELVHTAESQGVANPQAYAADVVSKGETMLKTMRLLSSDPDTLDRLTSIAKNPSWLRGLKDSVFERTIGTTAGFVGTSLRGARIGTVALTGAGSTVAMAAAPITAAIIGAFRGNTRAKQELREADRRARTGEFQKEKTAHRMSDVTRKISQLNAAREAFETAATDQARTAAAARLKTYTDFIEAKLSLGQVNFGSDGEDFVHQYQLIQSLQEAHAMIAAEKLTPELTAALAEYEKDAGSLYGRTLSLGARFQDTAEKARARKIRRATVNGLVFGGVAGTAGVGTRLLGEHFGWFGNHHEALATNSHTAQHSVQSQPAQDTLQKYGEAHDFIQKQVPDAAPTSVPENTPALPDVAARVRFSSKGIQQTLLNFRHSPDFAKLSGEQQDYFEGNIVKISKEIKGFRPDAADGKESLSFSEGSEFGVTADGKIFVIDKLSGKTTVLGHLEGSSFKADVNEADLTYIDTDKNHAAIVERKTPRTTPRVTISKKVAPSPLEDRVEKAPIEELRASIKPLDTAENPKMDDTTSVQSALSPENAPVQKASIEELRAYVVPNTTIDTVSRTVAETRDTLGASLREYVSGQPFTPRMQFEMDSLAGVVLDVVTDKHFSYVSPSNPLVTVEGHLSPAWLSFSSRSAKDVLATELSTYSPQYRPFIQEVKAMASKFPNISKEQSLGKYLKKVYRMLVEEQVLTQAEKRR